MRRTWGVALVATAAVTCGLSLVPGASAEPAATAPAGAATAGVRPATGSAPLVLGAIDPNPTVGAAVPAGGSVLSPSHTAGATRAIVTGGVIRQLNRNSDGRGGNAEILNAAVSPGGTMVAFWSRATNLYPGVRDGRLHLFVAEVATGKVIAVVDTSQAGVLSNDNASADGYRALAWAPRERGFTDSRFIAFGSSATNLGPATPEGWGPYLYVKNLVNGAVSLLVYDVSEAAWSPDGKKIAFVTGYQYGTDGNFDDDIWSLDLTAPDTANLWDVSTNSAGRFATTHPAGSFDPVWAPDSKRVLFASWVSTLVTRDTNGSRDLFVKDISTGITTRVSLTSGGRQANNYSQDGTWSPDGLRIAFASQADNLVRGDTNPNMDVFVKSLSTGAVRLVSSTSTNQPTLFDSYRPHFAQDGKRIAFMSNAVDLLPGGVVDTNNRTDVYIKNLATGGVRLVSITKDGRWGNADSGLYELDPLRTNAWLPGGAALVFTSRSTNFVGSDRNSFGRDLFIKVL